MEIRRLATCRHGLQRSSYKNKQTNICENLSQKSLLSWLCVRSLGSPVASHAGDVQVLVDFLSDTARTSDVIAALLWLLFALGNALVRSV